MGAPVANLSRVLLLCAREAGDNCHMAQFPSNVPSLGGDGEVFR